HYGRALLADFNLADGPPDGESPGAARIGGTLHYMAPEHLDAFAGTAPPAVIDARSDIYSLGVVLFELLTGRHPFAHPQQDLPPEAALGVMAAERRSQAPSPRQVCPGVPAVLDRVVKRCLEPEPGLRYPTAEELARALAGCRELSHAVRRLPQ